MELLLNDLSIHKQFSNIYEFREAVQRLMKLRKIARDSGLEVYCHRNVVNQCINSSKSVHDALQKFNLNEKRSLLSWFNKHGPYWEDISKHGSDDYVEAYGDVVTDTALGEASYCVKLGIDKRLVSLIPFQLGMLAYICENITQRLVDGR